MSEPSTPRSTLAIHQKRQRNASFSVRSENAVEEVDKSRKFFTTWRTACDKTKDKTRELLKRTLSWKGQDYSMSEFVDSNDESMPQADSQGWSVHVWTTWVKRSSMNDEVDTITPITLSTIQREKFCHFFNNLLDTNRDELISVQDFDHLSEKLRHFADWSSTSTEFSLLKQIQQEFIRTFFTSAEVLHGSVDSYVQIDDWLRTWSYLLKDVQRMNELPFWLQQLPKVLFLIINKSGSGVLTQDELRTFFISVVGLHDMNVDEMTDMYKLMTANGDFRLIYSIYELCFANWLLCRNPNGPGQWLFGKCGSHPVCFPIDYSALNAAPEDRETYTPDRKSNRHSIIV